MTRSPTRPPQRSVAAFDSAVGMVSALALSLQGKPFDRLGQGRLAATAVRASSALPLKARQLLYSMSGAVTAVPPDALGDIDIDAVSTWITEHYPNRHYPALMVGAANGAMIQLAAAAGIPWLPQTVLIPVRWPDNSPARPDLACEWGARAAEPLLRRNPQVDLHHMHDGAQDELMVSQMAYFRVKRRDVGEAYRHFISERLTETAPIILVNDRSRWPVTRVGDRHVFQTGAYGGMAPADYLAGPHAPAAGEESAEAEWGTTEAFTADLAAYTASTGRTLRVITTDDPQSLAAPSADIQHQWQAETNPSSANRLLISSFIQIDPWQVLRIGAVNYWTVFPVRRCLQAAQAYVDTQQQFSRIDATLFNHGAASPGLATEDEWRGLTHQGSRSGTLLGQRGNRFPTDFAALARASSDLADQPDAAPWAQLPLERILQLAG
jgi:hypothetical protein